MLVSLLCDHSPLRERLTNVARMSRTATRLVAGLTPCDLPPPAAGQPTSCVLACPAGEEDAAAWLGKLHEFPRQPKVIFLLARDDPIEALDLLDRGAFDVAYQGAFSAAHLRNAIDRAGADAARPPYAALCRCASESRPCPEAVGAVVFREGVGAETDRRDWGALSLLPMALGLPPDALVFQEVLTPPAPALPAAPALALALLSAEPCDGRRVEFLSAMRSLEIDGHHVVYLLRSGIALTPDLRPTVQRVVSYSSAIELALRLAFGFGSSNDTR
jgi:hypothetical protein